MTSHSNFGGKGRKIQGMKPAQGAAGGNRSGQRGGDDGEMWTITPDTVKTMALSLGGLIAIGLVALAFASSDPSDETATAAPATPAKPKYLTPDEVFNGRKTPTLVTVRMPIHGVPAAQAEMNRAMISRCSLPDRSAPRSVNAPDVPRYPLVDWSKGEVVFAYTQAAPVLACLMSYERARFCDPAERRDLARALVQYDAAATTSIQRSEDGRQLRQEFMDKSKTSMMGMILSLDKKNNSGGNQAEESNERWYGEITQNVRLMAQDGLLSARDFGSAGTGELGDFLVKTTSSVCKP